MQVGNHIKKNVRLREKLSTSCFWTGSLELFNFMWFMNGDNRTRTKSWIVTHPILLRKVSMSCVMGNTHKTSNFFFFFYFTKNYLNKGRIQADFSGV